MKSDSLHELRERELTALLSLDLGADVEDRIREALFVPLFDLLDRPRKRLRSRLTEVGFSLATGTASEGAEDPRLPMALEMVELLHAGSLIVDDIEDGSAFRRGEPSLHERYGVPVALNAGNWLYFWPLELIRRMELTPTSELEIYRLYHRTLLRAHFGQALDVGVSIDQVPREKIYATALASLELKSGSLAAFSAAVGALVAGGDRRCVDRCLEFGKEFGVALQMFDDLGNLLSTRDPAKRWEDLRLRRPSWIWANLAAHGTEKCLARFAAASSQLPDTEALQEWIAENGEWIEDTRQRATAFLNHAVERLFAGAEKREEMEARRLVEQLQETLVGAYA